VYNLKVLVTGATGFLGSHLTRRLIRAGHEVTILRRPTSDISPLDALSLHHVIGDITEVEAVNRAVEGNNYVIHAAAHIAYWRNHRAIQTRINVEGTRNVVNACKQRGVKRLLHVSSVAAIGIPAQADCPADETFSFNLGQSKLNYHISKYLAEQEVLKEAQNGLDAVVVNPGSIFGPFINRFRGGEMIDKIRRSKIVPYFLGGICAVHVDDVVDGSLKALWHGRKGERYILGGENILFRRIAELAAQYLKLKRVFVPVPSLVTGLAAGISEPIGVLAEIRPRITYEVHYCASRCHFYDSTKAIKELHYKPRAFADIVKAYITPQALCKNSE